VNYAHRSRAGLLFAAGLGLCALLASPGFAAPVLDTLPTLDTLRNRLELTPEQENKLAPLFDKRIAELRQTKDLLTQASTSQQKRDVLREAKKAGDEFNRQVESVLTPSQQHEWREIRSEIRERAKERAEEKREAG
jgi:Spy/CpxP family protein refolding chaperone